MGFTTALIRSAFLVNAAYARSGREFGVTPQQGQLLSILRGRPYGMTELGTVLGLAKSSVTGLVDRTERGGLVRREPDPDDSRAVRVALTPHGGELAERFYTETHRRIEQLPGSLSAAELETLTDLLARVVDDHDVSAIFMEADDSPR
ncbi:DNA-binding MarR family transcriptional regulator [Umezawaea tangerina]|uniref:DNA-binding MarR family transcriptional regulator n=2 Tax=Umezawaea tangerina TaxID=84725 RepID=A0A2T0TGT9_9PSEU|nr:MarR family transcriptional regulator [Umezawaea tangerina]PRY44831.1 DNA-binding MarR family transcriptional regulator [Umezawaea tangerina]